jgi:hypothetical protein
MEQFPDFRAVVVPPPLGDDSVDTSRQHVNDIQTITDTDMGEVGVIWGSAGLDTQGPAGARVADLDEEQARKLAGDVDIAEIQPHYIDEDEGAPEDAQGKPPLRCLILPLLM